MDEYFDCVKGNVMTSYRRALQIRFESRETMVHWREISVKGLIHLRVKYDAKLKITECRRRYYRGSFQILFIGFQ